MNREDFEIITKGTISDLVSWASLYLRVVLPNEKVVLVGHDEVLGDGIESAVDYLVKVVYFGPNEIKPCIDLTVIDFDETTAYIRYSPAGYAPRPFGLNWQGGVGPYIKCICGKLLKEQVAVLPNPGLFSTGTQFRSSANPGHSGTGFFGGFDNFYVFWGRGFIGAFSLRKADAFYPVFRVAAYGLRKYSKPLDIEFREWKITG
jgi:hypothetical protein